MTTKTPPPPTTTTTTTKTTMPPPPPTAAATTTTATMATTADRAEADADRTEANEDDFDTPWVEAKRQILKKFCDGAHVLDVRSTGVGDDVVEIIVDSASITVGLVSSWLKADRRHLLDGAVSPLLRAVVLHANNLKAAFRAVFGNAVQLVYYVDVDSRSVFTIDNDDLKTKSKAPTTLDRLQRKYYGLVNKFRGLLLDNKLDERAALIAGVSNVFCLRTQQKSLNLRSPHTHTQIQKLALVPWEIQALCHATLAVTLGDGVAYMHPRSTLADSPTVGPFDNGADKIAERLVRAVGGRDENVDTMMNPVRNIERRTAATTEILAQLSVGAASPTATSGAPASSPSAAVVTTAASADPMTARTIVYVYTPDDADLCVGPRVRAIAKTGRKGSKKIVHFLLSRWSKITKTQFLLSATMQTQRSTPSIATTVTCGG